MFSFPRRALPTFVVTISTGFDLDNERRRQKKQSVFDFFPSLSTSREKRTTCMEQSARSSSAGFFFLRFSPLFFLFNVHWYSARQKVRRRKRKKETREWTANLLMSDYFTSKRRGMRVCRKMQSPEGVLRLIIFSRGQKEFEMKRKKDQGLIKHP